MKESKKGQQEMTEKNCPEAETARQGQKERHREKDTERK